MKYKLIVLLLTMFLSHQGISQKYSFDDLVDFELLDAGPITSKNEVQGYYLFFRKDQLDATTSDFIIKILDQNLNELTNKEFTASAGTNIEALVFNGKSILIKQFANNGSNIEFTIQNMNISGDFTEMGNQTLRVNKHSRSLVYGVPDKGFVNIYGNDEQKSIVEFYNNEEQAWRYETPDSIKWEEMDYLTTFGNKVIFSSYRNNRVTSGGDYFLKTFDIESGELLYDKVMTFYGYDHKIDRGFVNPLLEEIWISGDYYEKGDEEKDINSEGLFVMKISPEGEILDSDYVPWDGKIERYANTYKKGKIKEGHIYVHDFVFLNDKQVFGIAEQYRKSFRAWGLAESVITAGTAGRLAKVDIGDVLVFRFGNNAKLVETKRNRKPSKRVLPNKGMWGGLLIPGKSIGQVMDDQNAYDFSHVSVNNDNEFFTVFYYMQEQLTKKQKKQYKREGRWILRTITYKDRQWSKDKFYLTDGKNETTINVLPAKPGYVLVHEISEEYRGLRLEKLK